MAGLTFRRIAGGMGGNKVSSGALNLTAHSHL
jgi:hypothetical protein